MKKLIALGLAVATIHAGAACYGTVQSQNCFDSNGNSYSVQRNGNQTNVYGTNAANGTQWNQQSTTVGNSTYTHGTAANGQSWNSTTTVNGNQVTTQGMNSQGQMFRRTCGPSGCY